MNSRSALVQKLRNGRLLVSGLKQLNPRLPYCKHCYTDALLVNFLCTTNLDAESFAPKGAGLINPLCSNPYVIDLHPNYVRPNGASSTPQLLNMDPSASPQLQLP